MYPSFTGGADDARQGARAAEGSTESHDEAPHGSTPLPSGKSLRIRVRGSAASSAADRPSLPSVAQVIGIEGQPAAAGEVPEYSVTLHNHAINQFDISPTSNANDTTQFSISPVHPDTRVAQQQSGAAAAGGEELMLSPFTEPPRLQPLPPPEILAEGSVSSCGRVLADWPRSSPLSPAPGGAEPLHGVRHASSSSSRPRGSPLGTSSWGQVPALLGAAPGQSQGGMQPVQVGGPARIPSSTSTSSQRRPAPLTRKPSHLGLPAASGAPPRSPSRHCSGSAHYVQADAPGLGLGLGPLLPMAGAVISQPHAHGHGHAAGEAATSPSSPASSLFFMDRGASAGIGLVDLTGFDTPSACSHYGDGHAGASISHAMTADSMGLASGELPMAATCFGASGLLDRDTGNISTSAIEALQRQLSAHSALQARASRAGVMGLDAAGSAAADGYSGYDLGAADRYSLGVLPIDVDNVQKVGWPGLQGGMHACMHEEGHT